MGNKYLYLTYTVTTMAADVLATQGARASAAMILILFAWIYPYTVSPKFWHLEVEG